MTPKLLIFLSLFCASVVHLHAAEPAKPNVLWIVLEDVSGWFGCYGEKLIETPHMDQLAAAGIRAVVTQRFKYLKNGLTDRPYMQPQYRDHMPVTIAIRAMKARGELNETQLLFYGDNKPVEELYDLESDPHEIRNLAGDAMFTVELARHRGLLESWIKETGDQGQQPEDEDGLIQIYYEWGNLCVNPEYDAVKELGIQPKPNPAREKAYTKAGQLLREAIKAVPKSRP